MCVCVAGPSPVVRTTVSGEVLSLLVSYNLWMLLFQVLDETDGRFSNMVDAIVGKFKLSAEVRLLLAWLGSCI